MGGVGGDDRSVQALVSFNIVHDLLVGGCGGGSKLLRSYTLAGCLLFVGLLRVNQFNTADLVVDLLDQQITLIQRLGHKHLFTHRSSSSCRSIFSAKLNNPDVQPITVLRPRPPSSTLVTSTW